MPGKRWDATDRMRTRSTQAKHYPSQAGRDGPLGRQHVMDAGDRRRHEEKAAINHEVKIAVGSQKTADHRAKREHRRPAKKDGRSHRGNGNHTEGEIAVGDKENGDHHEGEIAAGEEDGDHHEGESAVGDIDGDPHEGEIAVGDKEDGDHHEGEIAVGDKENGDHYDEGKIAAGGEDGDHHEGDIAVGDKEDGDHHGGESAVGDIDGDHHEGEIAVGDKENGDHHEGVIAVGDKENGDPHGGESAVGDEDGDHRWGEIAGGEEEIGGGKEPHPRRRRRPAGELEASYRRRGIALMEPGRRTRSQRVVRPPRYLGFIRRCRCGRLRKHM
ncbi:PREDICTED: sodium/potassium/calcium exchanger 1-like [Priapulus caudatus]|uniref:Sodium/potassium/calcium exchanger 1-like n=1 Tax=Priapulus caudatus TaxID=37621 RepID=A0ABM1E6E9_PRICU|nr:PREDICTED: sodium/potassium/calcium exchanger 1-like [Priapulus caudatus]